MAWDFVLFIFFDFVLYARPRVCLLNCAFSCHTDRRPNITCHPLYVRLVLVYLRSSKWFYSVSMLLRHVIPISSVLNDCHLTTIYGCLLFGSFFSLAESSCHCRIRIGTVLPCVYLYSFGLTKPWMGLFIR